MKLLKFFLKERKLLLSATVCFIAVHASIAQSTDRQLVSAAGNTFLAGDYAVDFSLGEPATATYHNTDNSRMITQGFHQMVELSVNIKEVGRNKLTTRLFPNPVEDILHLKINVVVPMAVRLQITSIDGRLVYTSEQNLKDSEPNLIKVPVAHFNAGQYLLNIYTDQNQLIEAVKFVKIK